MPKPLLIIKWGESNSAGRALNSAATNEERAVQHRLKFLNNTSFSFENLLIGSNNIIDHVGATTGGGITETPTWASSRHGWEVPLSTAIRKNVFGQRQIYMIHAGQGGSQSQSWGSGVYQDKLASRVNAAKSFIPNFDVIVWGTIGINNAVNDGLNYRQTYVSDMSTNLSAIRALLPSHKVPILLTGLTQSWLEYTEEVKRVCTLNPNTYFISSIGASESNTDGGDSNHWGYSGVQLIGNRLIKKTLSLIQPQL